MTDLTDLGADTLSLLIESYDERALDLQGDLKARDEEIEYLEAELSETQQDLNDAADTITEYEEKIEELESELKEIRSSLRNYKEDIYQVYRALDDLT